MEAAGVCEDVDVHVGTLSKAVGSQGGFVACSADMKRLLMNRGRPYVFSTALTLPSVAAAQAALVVNRQVLKIDVRLTEFGVSGLSVLEEFQVERFGVEGLKMVVAFVRVLAGLLSGVQIRPV